MGEKPIGTAEHDRQRPEMTFSEKLHALMREKGLSAPAVYKRGNIEKSLFSKMLSDPFYSPSKDTAIQTAFGLGLSLKEAKDLIGRAGYRLSRSIPRDVAIERCLKEQIPDVISVNILLSDLNFPPLGPRSKHRNPSTR